MARFTENDDAEIDSEAEIDMTWSNNLKLKVCYLLTILTVRSNWMSSLMFITQRKHS